MIIHRNYILRLIKKERHLNILVYPYKNISADDTSKTTELLKYISINQIISYYH
jgi:hypothetical protein